MVDVRRGMLPGFRTSTSDASNRARCCTRWRHRYNTSPATWTAWNVPITPTRATWWLGGPPSGSLAWAGPGKRSPHKGSATATTYGAT